MANPRIILTLLVLNTVVLFASVGLNVYLLMGDGARVMQVASMPVEQTARPGGGYQFFPVEKVIVNLRGPQREHYFVLDLVLQAETEVERETLERLDPVVRNSVVSHLSQLSFDELRTMSIGELQQRLEAVLLSDLAGRRMGHPFAHVLVSKMLVQ